MRAPSPALYIQNSTVRAENCLFHDNLAEEGGGGAAFAMVGGGSADFINCVFAGEITNSRVAVVQSGSGTGTLTAVNCTFAATSGGTFVQADGAAMTADFVNCAFDDTATPYGTSGGAIVTTSRCLYEGATGDNIDGIPTLVDVDRLDYRLAPGSLGIDAADHDAYLAAGGDVVDANGDDRLVDAPCVADSGVGAATWLDIGAFEFQPDLTDSDDDGVPDTCDICPGFDDRVDIDGDGVPDGCDTDCSGFPVHVSTAQELIDAIHCANGQPDANTIYLDADITLTAADNTDSNQGATDCPA